MLVLAIFIITCILLRPRGLVIVFLILPTEVLEILALVECQAQSNRQNDLPDLQLAFTALLVIGLAEFYVDYFQFGKISLSLGEEK